eukprot:GHRQ01012932.1.p1 GENE.GHRQ01012932.1~~GHRQ01012932.1.p1  ORF type:complete len:165 (-),score=29.82 GHRQ01012932.1:259-753(-)
MASPMMVSTPTAWAALRPKHARAMRPPSSSPVGSRLSAFTTRPAQPATNKLLTCTSGLASASPSANCPSKATKNESASAGESMLTSPSPAALRPSPSSSSTPLAALPHRGPATATSSRISRFGTKPLKRVMPPKEPMKPNPAGTMSGRYSCTPAFFAAALLAKQ